MKKNYAKVLRFGNNEQVNIVTQAENAIQENIAVLMREKAMLDRIATEERLKKLDSGEGIDLAEEQYYDVECPHCGEELSFMPWQADENSEVVCPMCNCPFKVYFVD